MFFFKVYCLEAAVGLEKFQKILYQKNHSCFIVLPIPIHSKRIWSERSKCDQRSNLGRQLFFVLIFFFFPHPITKIPEGDVVGL